MPSNELDTVVPRNVDAISIFGNALATIAQLLSIETSAKFPSPGLPDSTDRPAVHHDT
jgi:hypothetical protein